MIAVTKPTHMSNWAVNKNHHLPSVLEEIMLIFPPKLVNFVQQKKSNDMIWPS